MTTTTTTMEDGTTITRTASSCAPGDPIGGNWIRVSINRATPEQRAALERFAEELRAEDPERTVIVGAEDRQSSQAAISAAVEVLLKRQGRSISWLAGEVGMSRSSLSARLHVRTPLTITELGHLADALGVLPSALVKLAHELQSERVFR